MLELSEKADSAGDGSGVSKGPGVRFLESMDKAGGGALIGLSCDLMVSELPLGKNEPSNWVIGLISSFGARAMAGLGVGTGETGDGVDLSLNDRCFMFFSSSGFS